MVMGLGMLLMMIGMFGMAIAYSVKSWKTGFICLCWMLAGMFMGIGSSPAKDAPNGSPGMVAIGIMIFIASIIAIPLMNHEAKESTRKEKEEKEAIKKLPYRGIRNISKSELKITDDKKYKNIYINMFMIISGNSYSRAANELRSQLMSLPYGEYERGHHLRIPLEAIQEIDSEDLRTKYYQIANIQSKEEILKGIDSWIESLVSVDVIEQRLLYIVGNLLKDEKKAKEAAAKILVVRMKYYEQIEEPLLLSIDKNMKTANTKYDEYVTGETTGLGFGIITSSVAQMALYSAMDAYERNKELNRQKARASMSTSGLAKASALTIYNRMMNTYAERYREDLKKVINSIL